MDAGTRAAILSPTEGVGMCRLTRIFRSRRATRRNTSGPTEPSARPEAVPASRSEGSSGGARSTVPSQRASRNVTAWQIFLVLTSGIAFLLVVALRTRSIRPLALILTLIVTTFHTLGPQLLRTS